MPVGTATIDFGAAPGKNTTSVVVTGQSTIQSTSFIEAFLMYEATADHNAEEHLMVPLRLRCGTIVASTGFTIYAETELRLTKTFTVRWIWA